MWIVAVDTNYYPYIEKYGTEAEARARYEVIEMIVSENSTDEVFLAEVEEHSPGIGPA